MIIFLLLINSLLFPTDKHKVGVNLSSLSGRGLCYTYKINTRFEYQATGFVYFKDDNERFNTFLNFGNEFQINFFNENPNRFYAILGASILYDEFESEIKTTINGVTRSRRILDISNFYNLGLGIGFQRQLFNKSITINFSIAYQYQYAIKQNGYLFFTEISTITPNQKEYNGLGAGVSVQFVLSKFFKK